MTSRMRITEIKDGGRERFYISFDDGSQIKATASVVAEHDLYTGKEMDERAHDELRGASTLAGAKRRALHIIGGRAHSRGEIIRKLREKGESGEDSEAAADWLCDLGYINDAEYAGIVVHHYAAKGYGRARIRNELYRRHVPREFWDDALAEMPETDEKIDKLLNARLGGEEPSRSELKRATDALARRGFSWEEIARAVRRYRESLEDEQ